MSLVEELEGLKRLLDQGVISEAEFNQQKERLLRGAKSQAEAPEGNEDTALSGSGPTVAVANVGQEPTGPIPEDEKVGRPMNCAECGELITDRDQKCPKCKAKNSHYRQTEFEKKVVGPLSIIICIALAFATYNINSRESTLPTDSRAALCKRAADCSKSCPRARNILGKDIQCIEKCYKRISGGVRGCTKS